MEGKRDDASHAHLLARLFYAPAVDADVSGVDDALSTGAAFYQPNAVKIAVDPHGFFSLASSAKAWERGFCSVRGACRPRHFHASPARAKPTSLIDRKSTR